jgi:methylated-DNA-[protein]-cysteine S-methyltransferase
MNVYYYEYPVGTVGIEEYGGVITGIFFGRKRKTGGVVAETDAIRKAATQLDEYFSGRRKAFDLPLSPRGTDFQQSVWKALQAVPYGQTRSYKQIAQAVGRPKAYRAVGMANHVNPIAIVIPCHRVVQEGGGLGGYAAGLAVKEYLLELEKQ